LVAVLEALARVWNALSMVSRTIFFQKAFLT
jgi:hypothetical protein